MINLFPTVLYSLMLGMVVIALLEVFNRPTCRQSLFFTGLLLLLVMHLAGELFIYSGAYVYAPSLAGTQLPFRVLLGPALYFYAHATMSPEKAIDNKVYWLAASGPILVMIAMMPFFLLLTSDEKLALADPVTRDPELWKIAIFTCLFATTVFITYTLGFLLLAFKLHQDHVEQLMERYAEIEQRSLAWFNTILVIWGVVWLMYAVEFALGALGIIWFGSGKALPIIETIALAVFIQKALSQKMLDTAEKGLPRAKQSRVALLSTDKMQLIASKLEQAMKDQQLYLHEDLSLHKLSNGIDETENHISETLSQYLQTNFFQFVNTYRIEHAKCALEDKSKLITTIAYEVGFNSKSTFNTAFKKIVGQSPSAYRSQLLDNNRKAG